MTKNETLHAFIISLKAFLVSPKGSPEEDLYADIACAWQMYAIERGWEDEVATIEELVLIGGY